VKPHNRLGRDTSGNWCECVKIFRGKLPARQIDGAESILIQLQCAQWTWYWLWACQVSSDH